LFFVGFIEEEKFTITIEMALSASEISKLLKLRAVGWSQKEIADAIGTSQQVVAYHLKKLKEESLKRDPDEVLWSAILGGLAVGASIGAAAIMLAQLVKKT